MINMQIDVITGINMLGIMAFAFSGAMKAIREELDLLGIFALGIVYALGGGVLRDVLMNKIPYAFSANVEMFFAALGVVAASLVYKIVRKDISSCYYILIPDALGLAAFTMAGAVAAHQAGVAGMGLIFLAAITAVGGGIIGDLLLGKIPSVLKDDCYATCSLIGALSFYIVLWLGVNLPFTSLVSSGITFFVRLLAIQRQWSLPKLTTE